ICKTWPSSALNSWTLACLSISQNVTRPPQHTASALESGLNSASIVSPGTLNVQMNSASLAVHNDIDPLSEVIATYRPSGLKLVDRTVEGICNAVPTVLRVVRFHSCIEVSLTRRANRVRS